MAYAWEGYRLERRNHIAALFWRGMGHDRHGGPFPDEPREGQAIALDMTLEAADRALAAALKPEELNLGLMGQLFDDMDAHMRAGRWAFLNETVAALDPFLMSDAEITTYARTLFSGREHLPAWAPFVERARVAIGMRASDLTVLKGLG